MRRQSTQTPTTPRANTTHTLATAAPLRLATANGAFASCSEAEARVGARDGTGATVVDSGTLCALEDPDVGHDVGFGVGFGVGPGVDPDVGSGAGSVVVSGVVGIGVGFAKSSVFRPFVLSTIVSIIILPSVIIPLISTFGSCRTGSHTSHRLQLHLDCN